MGLSLSLRSSSDFSRQALEKARSGGFPVPTAPQSQPPGLPSDITLVDDEHLMQLFGELTAWADFACTQVAVAQVDERAAQRLLDVAEAGATARTWTTGDRVAVVKKRVAEDGQVLRATAALDEAHAYRKVLESIQANIDRDTALVSRELTRRTSSVRSRREWSP